MASCYIKKRGDAIVAYIQNPSSISVGFERISDAEFSKLGFLSVACEGPSDEVNSKEVLFIRSGLNSV